MATSSECSAVVLILNLNSCNIGTLMRRLQTSITRRYRRSATLSCHSDALDLASLGLRTHDVHDLAAGTIFALLARIILESECMLTFLRRVNVLAALSTLCICALIPAQSNATASCRVGRRPSLFPLVIRIQRRAGRTLPLLLLRIQ